MTLHCGRQAVTASAVGRTTGFISSALALAGLLLAHLATSAALMVLPMPAHAQGCYIGTGGDVNFGEVNPDANTDTQNNLGFVCQSNAATTYFRLCMYVSESQPLTGVNPRRMTNYNGAQMAYNLYSDAARTQIIGPPPVGAGFPVYSFTVEVPGAYVQTQTVKPIYARVPAGQVLPAGNGFQAQVPNSVLAYGWSNTGFPANCTSGTGTGSTTFYQNVTATVSNTCRITMATDLDFGVAGSLNTARQQTSTILLRCPTGTTWRMGLNNGAQPNGTVRRMRSAAGNFVNYELFRDSGRTQRWGNTLGTDTSSGTGQGEATSVVQTVYGRVPAQPAALTGSYSDTITVTLTY